MATYMKTSGVTFEMYPANVTQFVFPEVCELLQCEDVRLLSVQGDARTILVCRSDTPGDSMTPMTFNRKASLYAGQNVYGDAILMRRTEYWLDIEDENRSPLTYVEVDSYRVHLLARRSAEEEAKDITYTCLPFSGASVVWNDGRSPFYGFSYAFEGRGPLGMVVSSDPMYVPSTRSSLYTSAEIASHERGRLWLIQQVRRWMRVQDAQEQSRKRGV